MSKAKGSILVGAVKALRQRKDEALAVLPESMHRYLTDRILMADWYPQEDLLALIRALMKIIPGDPDQVLRGMGAATARELGDGVYSNLMTNSGSASTTFALWSSMHDSGTLKARRDAKTKEIVFELVDFGSPSAEMCAITGAFIQESVRMSGHTGTVQKTSCVLDGGACCRWTTS